MQNLKKKKENRTSHFIHRTSQNGITLIALIITIIVMLILVGVTVNVALNGGLFSKAETATYQTEASLVKEQLELAKAVETANNEGILNDYSFIKVENLDGLDEKTKNKFKNIILVNSNGDVCYNPSNVTEEEKTMLEAIGIKAYIKYEPVKAKVYGTEDDFIIITTDNRAISVVKGEKYTEATLTKVNNITEIEDYSNYIVESNGHTFDLYSMEIYFFNGREFEFTSVTGISKDKYFKSHIIGETVYIGGEDGTDSINLNESIDPTPYL